MRRERMKCPPNVCPYTIPVLQNIWTEGYLAAHAAIREADAKGRRGRARVDALRIRYQFNSNKNELDAAQEFNPLKKILK